MYTKEIIIFLLRLRNNFQVQRKKYTPKSYMAIPREMVK